MSALFVTGAGTDIGKTYVACRLIEALRARGRAVDALKPVVSGFDPTNLGESDPALLARALGRAPDAAEIARIAPFRFAAPLAPPMAARLQGQALRLEEIAALCRARAGDPLVIEGAGGVMSPLDGRHTVLDLIAALRAPCIVIGGSYLGAISHTLTALTALAARGAAIVCVIVSESAGAGVDLRETLAALRELAPATSFFALPRGGALDPAAVALIAAHA